MPHLRRHLQHQKPCAFGVDLLQKFVSFYHGLMDGNDLKTQWLHSCWMMRGLTKHMSPVYSAGGKKFGQLKAMQQEELDSINQVNGPFC